MWNVKACDTKSLGELNAMLKNLRKRESKVIVSLPNIESNMTGTNNRKLDNFLKMIILGWMISK